MHLNGSNGISSSNNSFIQNENNADNSASEIDLIKILNFLLLNKWIIIICVLIAGVASVVYSLSLIPIYKSRGTLMISQHQNRYSYAGSDLSSLLTTTYGIGVGSSISNELQILNSVQQSYDLANNIKDLEFDDQGTKFPILWRSYPDDSSTVGIDTVASRYRKNISFSRLDPTSDVVAIDFESPSPSEAALVVNLTMDSYSKLSTDQNRTMAKNALTFLQEEKGRIEKELLQTEDSLKFFMNETNLVAVTPQSNELISKLSSLASQKQTIEVNLVAINASIEQYENQLNEIKPELSEQFSTALSQIIERSQFMLAEAETNKLNLKVKNPTLTDESPEIKKINAEIQLIKDQIRELTGKLVSSNSDFFLSFMTNREETVISKISQISSKLVDLKIEKIQYDTQLEIVNNYTDELNNEFENLPDEIIQLARLERNVKINEQLFLLVANQLAEMSLWEKTQFGMGRPLDYAMIPNFPVSPKKKIIVLIGIALGLFISIGLVFIKEFFNDKITSSEDLKVFTLPNLGNIPDFKILNGLDPAGRQHLENRSVSNQLITFLDHISPISEAYRRLRINVIYANPDKDYKVIMVTSATKGEGKSTVAANLAVTFSEAEKSVLIIDLDLRRPTQHKIFGENKEPGLTDSLFETVNIKDIVKNTIAPNVDLLTVGKKTPEPATVLDSKRLKQLIDSLAERYDHVILDTAPYGIISDSASLLRLVDGMIVVSRFNVTTKKELSFTLDGLHHLNADILGVVLNAFDPKRSTDYYTNYAYYKRTYSDYYQEEKS